MAVLLLMPLMVELIMRGRMMEWFASAIHVLVWAFIAEGEMSAMAWIPPMVILMWNHSCRPGPLPPENREYVPKRR
jgi:hypothetical protein